MRLFIPIFFFWHLSDNAIQSSSQLVRAVKLFGVFNSLFQQKNMIWIIIYWFQPKACAQIVSGEFSRHLLGQMSDKVHRHTYRSSPFQRYSVSIKDVIEIYTASMQNCVYKCIGRIQTFQWEKMLFNLFTDNVLTEIDLLFSLGLGGLLPHFRPYDDTVVNSYLQIFK